jgi:hypothetical protein
MYVHYNEYCSDNQKQSTIISFFVGRPSLASFISVVCKSGGNKTKIRWEVQEKGTTVQYIKGWR